MNRQRSHLLLAFGLVALVGAPGRAAAQATNTGQLPANYGWTVTPSLLADTMFDDNALVRSNGGETPADLVSVINPRIAAEFKGRRGECAGAHEAALRLFRPQDPLNSYAQQESAEARRLVPRHVTMFGGYQMFSAPTTELLQFVGVPYVRTGSTSNLLSGGADAA